MLNAAALSAETLAAVLDQSVDCVKLIDRDGNVRWMNGNGLCAMEIDDFNDVAGRKWASFWPEETQALITNAYPAALTGETVRFDAFCPTAKGAPRWWHVTISGVSGVDGSHQGFLSISRDVSEAQAARQALEIAAAELRHRLKNTYAMIGSLIVGFARGQPDLEGFAQEMLDRLVALSAAQALFSNDTAPCEIATLIPALVGPFDSPICPVTVGPLPDTSVTQGQADAIALVLGELAVNSAKHGALSGRGAVAVRATTDGAWLEIVWAEETERLIAAHHRTGGQGLRLIDRIVRARSGTLDIAWREDGLAVTLRFALDQVMRRAA